MQSYITTGIAAHLCIFFSSELLYIYKFNNVQECAIYIYLNPSALLFG